MRARAIAAAIGGSVAIVMPAASYAQALSCTVPTTVPQPHADTPNERTPRRLIPTASYTLAIGWAPQFCREAGARPGTEQQCGGGNAFGFTLHGLWPDGAGKDWPQYCRPVELLPEATLRANLCATPSVQLLQHEWAKHGSCTNQSADAYFGQARHLYGALRYPDMDALSRRRLTAGSFAAAFARVNRGIAPGMMRITATRDGWLDEIWLCLDRNYRSTRCPAHQGGLAASAPLKIWRRGTRPH